MGKQQNKRACFSSEGRSGREEDQAGKYFVNSSEKERNNKEQKNIIQNRKIDEKTSRKEYKKEWSRSLVISCRKRKKRYKRRKKETYRNYYSMISNARPEVMT